MTDDRFWSKVDRNGPVVSPELGNCWIWTKALRSGYGTYSIKRKAIAAHRYSYEAENGPIPKGLLLRHRCDNRACVRPDHLEVGNHKENARDMLERNSNVSTLSVVQVVEARNLAATGVSLYTIVSLLDAPRHIIRDAISGESYSHITDPPPVALSEVYRPIYAKLTEDQYKEILDALSRPYHGQGRKLAEKYGVDPSLITLIKKRRLKTIRGASQE